MTAVRTWDAGVPPSAAAAIAERRDLIRRLRAGAPASALDAPTAPITIAPAPGRTAHCVVCDRDWTAPTRRGPVPKKCPDCLPPSVRARRVAAPPDAAPHSHRAPRSRPVEVAPPAPVGGVSATLAPPLPAWLTAERIVAFIKSPSTAIVTPRSGMSTVHANGRSYVGDTLEHAIVAAILEAETAARDASRRAG